MCKPANEGGVLYSPTEDTLISIHTAVAVLKNTRTCVIQVQSYSLLHINIHCTGLTVHNSGLISVILFILCF
jgi:hypothetical protein